MKKNPILAAVLNFFLFGGGTIYIGRRVGFGVVLTIGGLMAQTVEILLSPPVHNLVPSYWPFLIGGIVTMKLALAADGYREAKEVSGN